jgi:hypothetical protein
MCALFDFHWWARVTVGVADYGWCCTLPIVGGTGEISQGLHDKIVALPDILLNLEQLPPLLLESRQRKLESAKW